VRNLRLWLALLLVMSLSPLVICAEDMTPKYGGRLVIALAGSPDTLDPHKTVMTTAGRIIQRHVYEFLCTVTEDGIEPELAVSWEFVDDYTLRMYLRKGVKFHDGSAFDAEDVAYSIQRMKDPETASPNRAFVDPIESVVVLEPYVVDLKLSVPYIGLLQNLHNVMIISKESTTDLDRHPVGTGPFMFVEWVPGDHVTLRKFDGYWDPKLPYLDELVFKIMPDEQTRLMNLAADTIQVIPEITPDLIPAVETNPDLVTLRGPEVTFRVAIFVTTNPPMDNVLVRTAVAHCIDRWAYIDSVLHGYGTDNQNIYATVNPYFNPNTANAHPYDLTKARELFEEAGYPEDFPPEAYPLVVCVPAGNVLLERAAVLLQSSLREIGIECRIERYDVPTWLQVREKRHIIITYYMYGGAIDPSVILGTNLLSPAKNLPHYYNDEFIELTKRGLETTDVEKRKEIYRKIQEILARDVPFSIIAWLPQVAVHQSYVKGIVLNATNGYPIYRTAWIDR